MKAFYLSLAFFTMAFSSFEQERVPVFVSGEDGHQSYRIPAIIQSPNGDLLAFAEGRIGEA